MFQSFVYTLLFFTFTLHASSIQDAKKELQNHNIEKAISLFLTIAREGDDQAYFELGKIYYLKEYKKRDLDKAFHYFEQASLYGDQKARYNLALIYSQKRFKKQSFTKAYDIFLSLAQENYAQAQYMVGIYLLRGLGRDKNYPLAKRWLEQAYFENGYTSASCALADIYANGLGVFQNLGRARKLSQKYLKESPLCKKIFTEFKLYKEKYKKDKGFKFGYYK